MTPSNKKTPYIVATGFTSAFLGDERTLREFIVGDYVKEKMVRKGENAVLYLINDSYDPLNYRQLRIGVNKDEKLLKQFEKYCGRPIAEIPDPFECHKNYAQHFAQALLKRLHTLDIYPVILDSYQAYQKGYYADYISVTFENYFKIQETLNENFNNYPMKKLFYVQCPACLCIDATRIIEVAGRDIRFECERCKLESSQDISEIRGKLGWKLDCAARWNIYGIDMETFSKAHVAELGSFEISRFISKQIYGGKVPTIVKYGDVKISRELSYKLLEILPPEIIKRIFTAHLTRDLDLNKDFVENLCSKFPVRPGLSYLDYIQRELPKDALCSENQQGLGPSASKTIHGKEIEGKVLVSYGNRFSKFYYNKEHGVRLPDAKTISSIDQSTAETAIRLIGYALYVRNNHDTGHTDTYTYTIIKSYLRSQKLSPGFYQFLRRVFCQTEGPSIPTLLAILPEDYLNTILMIVAYSAGLSPILEDFTPRPQDSINDMPQLRSLDMNKNIRSISKLTKNLLEVIHEADENISSTVITSRPTHGMPEGE